MLLAHTIGSRVVRAVVDSAETEQAPVGPVARGRAGGICRRERLDARTRAIGLSACAITPRSMHATVRGGRREKSLR